MTGVFARRWLKENSMWRCEDRGRFKWMLRIASNYQKPAVVSPLQPSGETSPIHIWFPDFQPLNARCHQFYYSKPLSHWYFVMETLWKQCMQHYCLPGVKLSHVIPASFIRVPIQVSALLFWSNTLIMFLGKQERPNCLEPCPHVGDLDWVPGFCPSHVSHIEFWAPRSSLSNPWLL